MLNRNGDDDDVFFDSVESFRKSCDSSEEAGGVELGYQIWNSELLSVVERRHKFLQGMGLTEFVSSPRKTCEINENCSPDRIEKFSNRGEGNTSCSGRDIDGNTSNFGALRKNRSRRHKIAYKPNARRVVIQREEEPHVEECPITKKKIKNWWNRFVQKKMREDMSKQGGPISDRKTHKANRMKVERNRKRCMEFTAVYNGQLIQAHKGIIWTMKFSPDGHYLASGGEDGVVRIWRITSTDTSCKYFTSKDASKFVHRERGRKLLPGRKSVKPPSVIIPQKIFKIDETPLHEFYGHTDEVLDLCWSKSNCILSSSKDETVRMWKVGSDECLQVFPHNNYVTCIQFNPVDDGYFISGSIDGKVRVWGVSESRVVDWADVKEIITAVCYQPDGEGFIVGSISGQCRFYDASDNQLQLDAQICVQGKKKSSGNRITGLQFSPDDSQKIMITSADSKVRIFDGLDVIHKYRGLRNSGCQMSASFTSSGRHIISVGDDSRIYVWNYDSVSPPASKQTKSIRSCEHFVSEGVSVAVPWMGMEEERNNSTVQASLETIDRIVSSSLLKDSGRFSLGGWFSMDGRLRGLATWPEEKLPLWSVPTEDDNHRHLNTNPRADMSSTWGLVIVTAGCDGVIRTFHNFGLPVRL
ncbi:hypothetical protein ACHQM5_016912 [Ranunculus cassubicifolius]